MQNCPDLWRQYRWIKNEESWLDPALRSTNYKGDWGVTPWHKNGGWCYNCGEGGHLGHVCTEKGFDQWTVRTPPYVGDLPYEQERQMNRGAIPANIASVGQGRRQQQQQQQRHVFFGDNGGAAQPVGRSVERPQLHGSPAHPNNPHFTHQRNSSKRPRSR